MPLADNGYYCLHLLIGFNGVEVDHGGRLSAMGFVANFFVDRQKPLFFFC